MKTYKKRKIGGGFLRRVTRKFIPSRFRRYEESGIYTAKKLGPFKKIGFESDRINLNEADIHFIKNAIGTQKFIINEPKYEKKNKKIYTVRYPLGKLIETQEFEKKSKSLKTPNDHAHFNKSCIQHKSYTKFRSKQINIKQQEEALNGVLDLLITKMKHYIPSDLLFNNQITNEIIPYCGEVNKMVHTDNVESADQVNDNLMYIGDLHRIDEKLVMKNLIHNFNSPIDIGKFNSSLIHDKKDIRLIKSQDDKIGSIHNPVKFLKHIFQNSYILSIIESVFLIDILSIINELQELPQLKQQHEAQNVLKLKEQYTTAYNDYIGELQDAPNNIKRNFIIMFISTFIGLITQLFISEPIPAEISMHIHNLENLRNEYIPKIHAANNETQNANNMFIISHSKFMTNFMTMLDNLKNVSNLTSGSDIAKNLFKKPGKSYEFNNLDIIHLIVNTNTDMKFNIKHVNIYRHKISKINNLQTEYDKGEYITGYFSYDKNNNVDNKDDRHIFIMRHCGACHNYKHGIWGALRYKGIYYDSSKYSSCFPTDIDHIMNTRKSYINLLRNFIDINTVEDLNKKIQFGSSIIFRATITSYILQKAIHLEFTKETHTGGRKKSNKRKKSKKYKKKSNKKRRKYKKKRSYKKLY